MDHLIKVFLLILGLASCLALVSASSFRGDGDLAELQNSINCESVCGDCRCRGFYCGEECICECNGDNEDDNKCLTTMRNKCKKLQFPFEVLIQGPSGNRFMRSATLFEKLYEEALKNQAAVKRPTVVLYRPTQERDRRFIEDCDSEEDFKADAKDAVADVVDNARNADTAAPAAAAATMAANSESSSPNNTSSDMMSNMTTSRVARSTTDTPPAEDDDDEQGAEKDPNATTTEEPLLGLPIALAFPAAKAKASLAALQASHAAALARIKTGLALKTPILPKLPVQPFFTL